MRTTVTLDDELSEHVDTVRPSADVPDAAAIREGIRRSQELEECRDRVDRLEQELERVRREKRLLLEQREEHSQLVAAVERERTLEEERARASVVERAKWWLFGRDEGE
jgi:uncharacterized protein YhaN